MKRVLFVAAENAALPGGKVGGIGDVVRDLPVALAAAGWHVTVLTPAYGQLHTLPGASAGDRVGANRSFERAAEFQLEMRTNNRRCVRGGIS